MRFGRIIQVAAIGLIAALVMAGCATGSALGDERSWAQGMGDDVSHRVGNAERPAGEIRVMPDLRMDDGLPSKIGLSEPTGTWFFADGGGRLGYGLTGGVRQPGSEWAVTLFAHDEGGVPVHRDVRIRLTQRSPELEELSLLSEMIVRVETVAGEVQIAAGAIPDEVNALYALSAEVLDAEGRAEDTRASLIYVPAPEINASLATDRDVYGAADREGRLVLANDGPTVLVLGLAYTIEKRVGDEWRVVPLDLAFAEIALYLMPGETHEQTFDLSALPEDRYRIVKQVWAEGFEDLSATLAAEFRVER